MTNEKGSIRVELVAIIVIIVAALLYVVVDRTDSGQVGRACTEEAKICPDGSAVGRIPPSCEFAACPEPQDETAGWKTYINTDYNFQLTLTDAWRGYRVFSSQGSQGVGAPTYIEFAMPTSDKTKCVLSVTDEVCGYVAPFTITIIANDRSISTMDGKLGEDKTNAYYYSLYTHFNDLPDDLSKINFEIPKLISTFKFISSDETAGWKTYKNSTYGFELRYPSELIEQDCTFAYTPTGENYKSEAVLSTIAFHSKKVCPLPEGIEGPPFYLVINILDPLKMGGNATCNPQTEESKSITLSGIRTTQCMGTYFGEGKSPYVLVDHADYRYVIGGYSTGSQVSESEYLGIFDHIISTFKFTK